MFRGADVVHLERLHSLDEYEEFQESQPHFLRVVMEKRAEQGEELFQERMD